jgi:Cdc6-like AAA superfamily ATPase
MVLLFNLEALLVRPRKLAEQVSPERLPDRTPLVWERNMVAEHFAKFWTQPKRIVCLRRRDYTGKKAFRYHLRPCYTVTGEPTVVDQSISLVCEYDEAIRVLRAVKWEVVTLMPLSEQERIFEGEIYAADFHYGTSYSDLPAVAFLDALPEEPEDLRVPLAKWREYLVWRQKLAEEKAKVRYEFTEYTVSENRRSVRFFLKEEQVLEQLKTRFENEELKILPVGANTPRRPLQGIFESIRAEGRHEDRPRGHASSYHSSREGTPKGTPEKLSLVLRFDEEQDFSNLGEGVLQLAMEGELNTIDVQIQGLARLAEGRAMNPRLRTWLFDVGKAPAISEEKVLWHPDNARRLNPEQRGCVDKALAMDDLLLLWGPPGTGKTTVIAEICSQYVRRGRRVLVSSQANLAVTQALERLPHLPHLRPIFISSARKRENLPLPKDFIKNWFTDIKKSCASISTIATSDPWHSLVSGWMRRLETVTDDDYTVGLTEIYLRCANVVGATCNETGKPDFITSKLINPCFDLAIVDEVSKATPPEMLLPMLMGQRSMLVGDHRQLPPMFRDTTFEEARENKDIPEESVIQFREMVTASLFERYFRDASSAIKSGLRRQYRMHPQIMAAVNHFYADQPLLPGDDGSDLGREKQHGLNLRSSRGRAWLQTNQNLIWIDTSFDGSGIAVKDATQGTSRTNAVEAEVCAAIVRDIFQRDTQGKLEVAVISFYKAQIGLLRERFRSADIGQNYGFNVNRDINTVDQFQGSERDVVIVSLVRTGPRLTGEFVRDFRRINVAFSRAKKLLIILAGRETFSASDVDVPSAKHGQTEAKRVYAKIHELARMKGAAFTAADILAPNRPQSR